LLLAFPIKPPNEPPLHAEGVRHGEVVCIESSPSVALVSARDSRTHASIDFIGVGHAQYVPQVPIPIDFVLGLERTEERAEGSVVIWSIYQPPMEPIAFGRAADSGAGEETRCPFAGAGLLLIESRVTSEVAPPDSAQDLGDGIQSPVVCVLPEPPNLPIGIRRLELAVPAERGLLVVAVACCELGSPPGD